jgi:hypothetical protein
VDGASVDTSADFVPCHRSLVYYYYYFGNKEGLRKAVLGEMVQVNLQAWTASRGLLFAG